MWWGGHIYCLENNGCVVLLMFGGEGKCLHKVWWVGGGGCPPLLGNISYRLTLILQWCK